MAEKEIKRVIKIESGQSTNTLNNLNARIKELKGSMGDLDMASEEYKEISEEINKLDTQKRNAIRGVTAAVEGSYNAYSKELSILQQHRKTLNENTEAYKETTKKVKELQDKLKQMDAEVGTHTRNVGNYSSAFYGLQGSVNQVARELPVLTMGADRFFLAISNNLPILFDSIKAYKALGAEQNKGVGIWKALGSAIFSWNTALTIGITLLVQYGDEIVGMVKKLFRLDKAVADSADAMRESRKEMLSAADGMGELIMKLRGLQEAWNNLGNDLNGKEKFIEEHRSAFEELGIAVQSVNDAESLLVTNTDKYITALEKRAIARAALKLAEEKYEVALAAEIEAEEVIAEMASKKGSGLIGWAKRTFLPQGMQLIASALQIESLGEEASIARKQADILFGIARTEGASAEAMLNQAGMSPLAGWWNPVQWWNTPTTKTTPTSTTTSKKFKIPAFQYSFGTGLTSSLGANPLGAADEAAEYEKLKRTLQARVEMASASAEERVAIEQRLADELAMIEEIRLTEHEIILSNMLLDEELTADERIAIEEQLTEVKIEQMDNQLKAEEERAKKAKEIKDKEVEEEKKRKEQMIAISTAMATATSNILKNSAELLQEDSKERKALNAAAIVMDTYTAAMAGWKSAQSLMYPFNLIAGGANVAASIAMGAAQLKSLYAVAEDGSNAYGSLTAPNVASSMPASYTRSLQGDNELTELNKNTRVYVVESDITNAQKSARVRVESASF